jgi:hypothetical protein
MKVFSFFKWAFETTINPQFVETIKAEQFDMLIMHGGPDIALAAALAGIKTKIFLTPLVPEAAILNFFGPPLHSSDPLLIAKGFRLYESYAERQTSFIERIKNKAMMII